MTMSPRLAGASSDRSAMGTTVSPSYRNTSRSSAEAISSAPSGRKPRPDAEGPGSGRVVSEPAMFEVCTASPSMSENHSKPSNQRGPSPKQKPLASGSGDIAPPPYNTPQKSQATAPHGA